MGCHHRDDVNDDDDDDDNGDDDHQTDFSRAALRQVWCSWNESKRGQKEEDLTLSRRHEVSFTNTLFLWK